MALETVFVVLDQTWQLLSNAGAGRFAARNLGEGDVLFSIGSTAPDSELVLGFPAQELRFDSLDGKVWARVRSGNPTIALTRVVDPGNPAVTTLKALSLSTLDIAAGVASGTVLATIGDRVPGSKLSVLPNDGRFAISDDGTTARLVAGLSAIGAEKIPVSIVETHPKAANSPRRSKFTLTGAAALKPLSIVTTGQSTASYTISFALAEMNAGLAALLTPPGARMAQGATAGTFLRKSTAGSATNYWVNDDVAGAPAVGPVMQTCLDMIASEVAAGRRIGAFLAAGHESEAGQVGTTAKQTAYRTIQKWVWDTLRAAVVALGQAAPPVITCVLGRRGDDPYSFSDGVQFIKASQRQFAADFPWIFNMPEVHDIQTDGGAHLATAGNPNGWQQAAPRYTRKVGKVLGATVAGGVDGPRITGAVRLSTSADVLVTISHDGGTDFGPATDIQPFRYLVNGAAVTISSAVRASATTVRLTLAAVPASGATEQLQYAYGAMTGTDYTKALKDNQAVPLPLRWFDGAVSVQQPNDTTAPTVTSNGTGSTANNTAYSETLTADEAATFAKGSGDQTAAFTLTQATVPSTTATLTLPATATAGTYVANLTATDAAGNVRNVTRSVTVAAATPELADAWGSALFNHRVSDLSGQTMANRVAAPADGQGKAAWDAYLGSSTSSGGDDPTFVATSGGVPAMLTNDGGDSVQIATNDFVRKLSLDKSWSHFMLLKNPSSWASAVATILSCGSNSSTQLGMIMRYVQSSNQIRLLTSDGSTQGQVQVTVPALPTTGYLLLVITYDAPTKAYKLYVNAATPIAGTATALQQVTADATRAFVDFGSFPSGAGLIEQGMAAKIVTDAEVAALKAQLESRYALGSIY